MLLLLKKKIAYADRKQFQRKIREIDFVYNEAINFHQQFHYC